MLYTARKRRRISAGQTWKWWGVKAASDPRWRMREERAVCEEEEHQVHCEALRLGIRCSPPRSGDGSRKGRSPMKIQVWIRLERPVWIRFRRRRLPRPTPCLLGACRACRMGAATARLPARCCYVRRLHLPHRNGVWRRWNGRSAWEERGIEWEEGGIEWEEEGIEETAGNEETREMKESVRDGVEHALHFHSLSFLFSPLCFRFHLLVLYLPLHLLPPS
mmetsp:Transcript_22899/g.40474  ORF Transcript_22899/g.40474 Transcript_22899/m.40474 type:complete len:220 (+) Transcript_22899:724-1383(+)